MTPAIRAAAAEDVEALAKIWYDGWQDAHARIVPAALARYRTLDNFRERLHAGLRAYGSPAPAAGRSAST